MIALEQIAMTFHGEELFSEISLLINPRDRIGLVGRNGSGKSTLFKIIAGELKPTAGQVTKPADITIGHLAQHIQRNDSRSIINEALTAFEELQGMEEKIKQITSRLSQQTDLTPEAHQKLAHQLAETTERYHMLDGEKQRPQAERTLLGLGFEREQLDLPTATLSGGWRMRIELAKILLKNPQLLLLDEPTNHLDIESIQWLEEYLKTYSGALILISHDKRFLDNITTRTTEITLGQAYTINAPYSQFKILRQEQKEQQEAAYKNQQKVIEKTEEFIEKFRYKPTKSNQVQSRIKLLEKLERIEIDETDNSSMHFRFPPAPRAGDTVVSVHEAEKRFENHTVFTNASLAIQRGEKVAFVGRNGEGKTTMARLIQGEIPLTSGEITLGHNVSVGYFAQNQENVLNPQLTVLETIDQIATGPIRTKIRDLLGAFLFRGDDVDKPVRILSGGERNRLAMVKLMLHPHNLLILDEPTNHLDIQAKEILKQALTQYDGTLIIVSHDRDFLDGLVGKIYEFTHRRVREHLGGIDAFLHTRQIENLDQLNTKNQNTPQSTSTGSSKKEDRAELWRQRKQRENELQRRRDAIAKLEDNIEVCEKEITQIENQLSENPPQEETEKLYKLYESLQKRHTKLLKEWEEKAYELEIIEEQDDLPNA